jgi:hypothetical protein
MYGKYTATAQTVTDGEGAQVAITSKRALQVALVDPVTGAPASVTDEYETVAASQTAQVLGPTGATGDYLSGLLVIPATTSPGNVLLLDNATSITVFAGGASSVLSLIPFFIPIGAKSVSGAWKVTTGANVSVVGVGQFT